MLVLLALASTGCISKRYARRYDGARLVGSTVEPGGGTVLQLYRFRGIPIPHAFSGYSLLLEVAPTDLEPGTVIGLPLGTGKQYLWVLRAPRRQTSTAITGTVTITRVRNRAVTAEVAVESSEANWAFRGRARFKPAELRTYFLRSQSDHAKVPSEERVWGSK